MSADRPAPLTASEISIQRAYDRARDHVRRGVVPLLVATQRDADSITERWAIPSASRSDVTWIVDLLRDVRGIGTLCQCEAATNGRVCWHRAIARLAHLDVIPVRTATPVRYHVRPGVGPHVW